MQTNKWKQYKLKDLIDINVSSVSKKDNLSCILYLDTGSVIAGKIKELLEVSYNNAPSRAKRRVKNNSIVYSMVRPNQLHYGLIKNPSKNMIVSTGFAVIDCYEERANSKFIYYWLTQSYITNFLQAIAENSTSAYPAIRPEDLENLEISLPPLDEQKRIAEVLGAFDDKIELLQKQNKTLEDMAKAIFKSWFVDFDVVKAKQRGNSKADIMREYHLSEELYDLFPSSFEGSSLGSIPTGWEVKVISDIAKVSTGKRPQITKDEKTELYRVPVYGGNGIKWWTDTPLYVNPIIITGRVGTLGQVYRIYDSVWVSDNALVFETMPENFEYLFYNLKNIDFSSFNRGSTQPLITQGDIKNISCVYSKTIIKKFHTIVVPYERKMQNNNKQIKTLTELRDSLLPRLISGKISI